MKYVLAGNNRNKLNRKSQVLLGALALVAVIAIGTAVQAAQDDEDVLSLYNETAMFNPFTLRTRAPSSGANVTMGATTIDEPIRISSRPPKRSPSRPPWAPPRGKPPWNPPGPPPK